MEGRSGYQGVFIPTVQRQNTRSIRKGESSHRRGEDRPFTILTLKTSHSDAASSRGRLGLSRLGRSAWMWRRCHRSQFFYQPIFCQGRTECRNLCSIDLLFLDTGLYCFVDHSSTTTQVSSARSQILLSHTACDRSLVERCRDLVCDERIVRVCTS